MSSSRIPTRSRRSPTSRRARAARCVRSSPATSTGSDPPPACGGSGAARCCGSPRAIWPARRSTRSSPRSARSPTRASRRPLAAGRRPADLAVIALGKLGGSELNYASDVDLLFVHRDPGPGAQATAERAVALVTALLAEPTADGLALRVDVALRPGGRAGALSRSLEATLAYYERESATWERQAMIKARPVAGDHELGRGFVDGVTPFVYPPELAPAAIDDVRRTKVRLEEYIRQRGKEFVEVKRGRGGIRDVEFAVQLLQIVHGRRDPRLRTPEHARRPHGPRRSRATSPTPTPRPSPTPTGSCAGWSTACRSCATCRPTTCRADRHARTTLARSLDLADADALAARVRPHDRARPLDPRAALLPAAAGVVRRPDAAASGPGTDRPATEELLGGLGFAEPARSYDVLGRLVDPTRRIGKVLAHLFPVMAPALALSPTPDAALVRLERVAEAVGDGPCRGRRPRDRSRRRPPPRARRRRQLVRDGSARGRPVADPRPLRHPVAGRDRCGRRPRRCRRAHASRELSPRETGEALSAVAVRVIREALEAAEPPADLPFAVIGMGKLGARELNVASDLDVVFVYEGEGSDAQRSAGQLAERVMRLVREAGWELDADLRPEGRNGPLARSIAGFLEYWQRYAEPWEFQTLLRARAIAGDPDLGRRFELNAADVAFPPDGITIDRVAEIRRMRERIERERVKPARGDEVPLQARGRLARRRAVRGGALADATRRLAPRDPLAAHAGGDRSARRGEADRADRWPAIWGRRSSSAPT